MAEQKTVATTGNLLVAEAFRQCAPDVVAAYPITPQTTIVEEFAKFVAQGRVHTEYVTVESEHSAMSASVGASAAGARTMTATSSQGLALMWEELHIASGMRLPIGQFTGKHGPHSMAQTRDGRIWITNALGDHVTRFPASDPSKVEVFSTGGFSDASVSLGFDANALRTTAVEDVDSYVLDGEKTYVPYAAQAEAMIVYARLGERRVVPIVLENSRRREKTIHLEMSEFKTRGGDQLGVKSVLTEPVDFPLPACSEHQSVLVVELGGAGFANEAGRTDVDECKVLYSDLRVEGCDIRPLRLALAVLPRDCDPFEVDCGCTCC